MAAGMTFEFRCRWSRPVVVEGEQWLVIRAFDRSPREDCFPDVFLIRAAIVQWRWDSQYWSALQEMYRAAFGFDSPLGHIADRVPWLEERVADAFQNGALVLVKPVWEQVPGVSNTGEKSASPDYLADHDARKDARKQDSLLLPTKTWVEIKLLDQDGVVVPNERYRVKLPDGTIIEGNLDENGWMRESGIDPGQCEITFPDIHQLEWDPE
ncbi:MAG TPA: hypothetical protein VG456_21140 [Candidatus Sulfopaludibacter sp.]|nr:hypothetical protein [Candidatus Sulfopaludibacter sp.]